VLEFGGPLELRFEDHAARATTVGDQQQETSAQLRAKLDQLQQTG
jgi:hypothetical protein